MSTSNPASVNLKIKLFDPELPLPDYQTSGSVGFDLYCRTDLTIPAHQVVHIPLNFAIDVPDTHWLMIAARSSLHKHGLLPINGIGVGDNDYRGDQDEYRALVYNYTDHEINLQKGDRIYQGILIPKVRAQFELVDHLEENNRGGIGSTGR